MDTKELYDQVLELTTSTLGVIDQESTAFAIFPGIADSRISDAEWNTYTGNVWVAGTRGDPEYSRVDVERLLARDAQLPLELLCQGWAAHAHDQMMWVAQCLRNHPHITTLILSTALYHLPRCTLTFIKVWKERGDGRVLRIAVAPTRDPHESEFSVHKAASHSEAEELERIQMYQRKGDVATSKEFELFLRQMNSM